MVSYESYEGRLVEIRIRSLTLEEVDWMVQRARSLMLARSDRLVCCVDMRHLAVLSPEVSEAMLGNLKARGERIERTGVLLPEASSILALQIERLHREAGNPARRTFRSAPDLVHFLGPALTPGERARLNRFLVESPVSGIAPAYVQTKDDEAIGRRGR